VCKTDQSFLPNILLSLGKRVPLDLSPVQSHHTGSRMKNRDKFIVQDCHSSRPRKAMIFVVTAAAISTLQHLNIFHFIQ